MTDIEHRDGSLILRRTFDAPREAVFRAWTQPELMEQWWGCAECTGVQTTMDLRVGGTLRNIMQIENCGEVDMVATFTEVDPPNRLAFTTPGGPSPAGMPDMPDTTTTAVFTAVDANRTEVQVRIDGLIPPFDQIVSGGWQASLEKLAKAAQGGVSRNVAGLREDLF